MARSMVQRVLMGSLALAVLGLCSCSDSGAKGWFQSSKGKTEMKVEKTSFGTVDGKEVSLFTLTNGKGMTTTITNYGGIVVTLTAPDSKGKFEDVVLGYDKLDSYVKDTPYFGAIVGRYGNRICKGKFTVDGKEYTLAINNKPNALHGGLKGFDKVVWDATSFTDADAVGLKLNLPEQGRRGGLSWQSEVHSDLPADHQERAEDRLRGDDRQSHPDQPDQPHLLQSGRPGQGRHSRS